MVIASLTAAGCRYYVHLSAMDDEGRCDPDTRRIYINSSLPLDARHEVLCHEYLHALFEASGGRKYLASVLADTQDPDAVEEVLVRILAPHLRADIGPLCASVDLVGVP